ncbi:Tat pathway signal sequence domain protein [Streptomyces sp. ISL-12]|uniref:Tat pathway signal sequence domain protein n=1 Tax=Streptomyces sp. ISL-12 TaxID=2819177 RepID=UPI001BECF491|nr:Tat pathway signal sequence domain protein [Streptomyces sp. ISL-12]MBT2411843.1 Tat pathway signal sequence domain protein [Streptomyces sp. ISL-12]
MSGTGPVEPGEGTEVRPAREAPGPLRGLTSRYRVHGRRHRRTALVTVAALCAPAAGGYLYASRPQPRPAPPPSYPSQVVRLAYLAPVTPTGTAPAGTFGFTVALTVRSGPPVTVTRVTQSNAGLSVRSSPRAPFRIKAHSTRKITVTFRATECAKVPRNAGFPFLDVTLRNARAIETHSFILGPRYARHLSEALQGACGNVSP